MIDFEQAKKMLTIDEARKYKPYFDSRGVLSIGIGRNLIARGWTYTEIQEYLKIFGGALTDEMIDSWFVTDVSDALRSAIKIFGVEMFSSWSDLQRLGVINMIFNMGEKTFLTFKRTIKLIKLGEWEQARENAKLSLWAQQVGKRSERVTELFINKDLYGLT